MSTSTIEALSWLRHACPAWAASSCRLWTRVHLYMPSLVPAAPADRRGGVHGGTEPGDGDGSRSGELPSARRAAWNRLLDPADRDDRDDRDLEARGPVGAGSAWTGSTTGGLSSQEAARWLRPTGERSPRTRFDELRRKTDIPGVLPSWLQPIQTRIVMLQSGFRAMMGGKSSAPI